MSTRSFDLAVSQSQTYAASSPSIDRALTEAWQRAVDLDWFWQPRGWQKWSLRTCLEPMFHNFWFRCIPELWKSFTGSRIYLQKEHPYGICVPLISGPKETGFIMAAHNEKIPVIFYQHGASMGDIENACWDIEDSNYSDFQLVYGVRAAKYIRSRHNFSGSRAVPIPVGSARLDLVSHGISEKKVSALRRSILGKNDVPLIVYVPGIFLNNTFRYTYLDCRDCRTFNLRSRVAEIFNNHPEMHFSYKAFVSSGHDPTLEMMKKICPKCSIIDNILLTELQWAADFIIYEVPSTGMYEGLITNKPMIVHVDRDIYRMPNEVKDLLWKRVCITETSLDLIEKVNQFLEHPDFTPVTNPDREFIKAFCTHFDDGQSTQRAADAITIIVKNKGDQVLQSDIVC
jgi:hypothetical protein